MHGTGRVSSPWPQRAQPPWGSLLNSTCGDFTLAPWNCPPWCIYTTAIGKRYKSGFCFFFSFPKSQFLSTEPRPRFLALLGSRPLRQYLPHRSHLII